MSNEQPKQYPDPEAIRQKRIAEVEQELTDLGMPAGVGMHLRAQNLNAELSRLRNEQPKGGEPSVPLERFWLELREPGCVPERKGPWPDFETAKVLREFMDARPTAHITVITWYNDGPYLQDGPECLMMCDRRSMQRARRHIKSSAQAESIPSLSPSSEPQDVRVTDAMVEAAWAAYVEATVRMSSDKAMRYAVAAALAQSDAQPVGWQETRKAISRRLDEFVRQAQEAQVDTNGSDRDRTRWTFKEWRCVDVDELINLASEALDLTAPPSPDASGLIEAAEWQSIETAPKDKWIFGGKYHPNGKWAFDLTKWDGEGWWQMREVPPTHWTSVPPFLMRPPRAADRSAK